MEPELKQRIIGTIVVTALAAIFIPMLFDEPVDNSGKAVAELNMQKPPVEADLASKAPANKEQVLAHGEPDLAAAELNDEDSVSEANPGNETKPGANTTADVQQRQDFIPPGEEDTDAKDIPGNAAVEEPVNEQADQNQKTTLDTGTVDAATPPARNLTEEPSKPRVERETAPKTTAKVGSDGGNAKSLEKTKPESKKKTASKLVRWSIQAGSFSKKENAQSLVEKLRKQGLPATIVTKGNLYRVKVGPELDKKKAADMKAKLDRQNITSYLHSE
jgi:DedD protein